MEGYMTKPQQTSTCPIDHRVIAALTVSHLRICLKTLDLLGAQVGAAYLDAAILEVEDMFDLE
jgi:hypothetical protein